MSKPKMVGTINGFWPCDAEFKGRKFAYNGTTSDLSKRLSEMGATIGEKVTLFNGRERYENTIIDRGDGSLWVSDWK